MFTQVPVYDAEQVFTGDAASCYQIERWYCMGTGNQYGQLGLGHKRAIVNFYKDSFP